jgi:hypothetical protein
MPGAPHHASEGARLARSKPTLDRVKTLTGLLPICMYCKRIRDDQDYWRETPLRSRAPWVKVRPPGREAARVEVLAVLPTTLATRYHALTG